MPNDSDMAEYYRLGYSLKQVGDILGMDKKTVRRRLVAQGIEIRPGNNVERSNWLTRKELIGGQI